MEKITSSKRVLRGSLDLQTLGMLVLILLMIIIVSIRNPHFLDPNNLKVIFMDTAILGIAAVAILLVMLTGNIDVSSSSIIAVTGFSAALLMKNYPLLPSVTAIGLGLLLGAILGAFNGVIVAYGRVPSIIVTLGTLSIYRGINFIISGGSWVVSRDLPDSFRLLANGTLFGIPNAIIYCILIGISGYLFLKYTRSGRYYYTIGSNSNNARILGIKVEGLTLLVFTIAGVLFGLAGVLWVSRFNFAQTSTASGFELTVIAAAVIGGTSVVGGRGTVPGVILGSFLLSFIINGINVVKISPFWKMAIQGLIILIAVIFDSWMAKRKKLG
jgi:rhamnose transport system permease protein